eukprot:1423524-Pyramimonas_sp.AAC.1
MIRESEGLDSDRSIHHMNYYWLDGYSGECETSCNYDFNFGNTSVFGYSGECCDADGPSTT